MLPPIVDPNVTVGRETAYDAAVYLLTDDLALVLTVDYFTPIVDDPYAFGQIAAANSLSDVYAMGGRPIAMLSIVGFPKDRLPLALLGEILRGGAEKAREAGVAVVGGHSIDDAEPKIGYAVAGLVHPGRIWKDVVALAEAGMVPGGTKRNLRAAAGTVRWDPAIPDPLRAVVADAQTSGGLLIATPDGVGLLRALAEKGVAGAAVVGELVDEDPLGTIEVEA